jgi:hypothetical protein
VEKVELRSEPPGKARALNLFQTDNARPDLLPDTVQEFDRTPQGHPDSASMVQQVPQ